MNKPRTKAERYPAPAPPAPYFKAKEYGQKVEKGEVSMPSAQTAEQRDETFWKHLCEYVYGSYSNGYSHIRNGGYLANGRTITELRAYARGEQSVNKYKHILDFRSDTGERRELDNISWENTRLFPRFRNQALSKLAGSKHKPGVKAMDTAAVEQRENMYLRDKLVADPRTKGVMGQAGVSLPSDTPMIGSMSQADVDVLNTLGGYALSQEILMIDAIQASLSASGWDESLRDMLDQDLFDIGFCGYLVYRNAGDGKMLARYCDPKGLIIPMSNYNDFRDNQYRAVVERRSMSSLIEQYPDYFGSKEGEDKLIHAARVYSGYMKNPTWSERFERNNQWAGRAAFSANRNYRYDEFSVEVMTVYFRAIDVERYISGYHNTGGNYMFDRVRSDYVLDSRDIARGKKIEDIQTEYLYRCSWVIGTDLLFDYGRDKGIVRVGQSGNKRIDFPLQVYALNEPSLTDRCIPLIDDIEIAVRKKRLSLAMLPPGPGYMIDISLMKDSVVMGDETYSIMQLLGFYFNNGFLYYESKGEFQSNFDGGSNRPPITPMPSQKIQEIQTFIIEMQTLTSQLQDTLGLNAVATGEANTDRLLNGVANSMQQSANDALRLMFTAVRDVFLNAEAAIAMRYQVHVLNNDIEIKYVPGTRTLPKIVKLTKDIFDCEFYFTAEMMPSMEDKQALIAMLQKLTQERRIGEDAYFAVMNMINEGDVRKAEYMLSVHAAKSMEAERKMQQENITLQARANAESATQAEQARAQAEQMIVEAKKQLVAVEGNETRKTEELKHRLRMVELTSGNFQNAALAAQQTNSLPAV